MLNGKKASPRVSRNSLKAETINSGDKTAMNKSVLDYHGDGKITVMRSKDVQSLSELPKINKNLNLYNSASKKKAISPNDSPKAKALMLI